jgi:hypothetical protein
MHHRSHRHPEATLKMARVLGWLSIGIGVAELLAPRQVARAAGMDDRSALVRLYGGREIVQGVGILLARDPGPWVLARVAGDVLDMGTVAAGSRGGAGKIVGTLAVLAAIGMIDLYCARRLTPMRVSDPEKLAEYRGRSGFPRPAEAMRGRAANGHAGPPAQTMSASGLAQAKPAA